MCVFTVPIQGAHLPRTLVSQDRLGVHHHPDQDISVTEAHSDNYIDKSSQLYI